MDENVGKLVAVPGFVLKPENGVAEFDEEVNPVLKAGVCCVEVFRNEKPVVVFGATGLPKPVAPRLLGEPKLNRFVLAIDGADSCTFWELNIINDLVLRRQSSFNVDFGLESL